MEDIHIPLSFRLKLKFWNTALKAATWLLVRIERRAAKSVGLLYSGVILADGQGRIKSITCTNSAEQTQIDITFPFEPN